MERHHKYNRIGYSRRSCFVGINGYLTDESEYDSEEEEYENKLVDLSKITNFKDSCNYISKIVHYNDCSFNYSEEVNLLPECLNRNGISINRHYQFELFKLLTIKLSPIMSRDLSNIATTLFEFLFSTNVYWNMDPMHGYLQSNLPYYANREFYMFNELWPGLKHETSLSDAITIFDNESCVEDKNLTLEFKSFLQPINKLDEKNMYLLKLDDGRFYRNSNESCQSGVPFIP